MDTPASTAAAARPPYGGGMEEFHWRSRFVRWSISVMGLVLFLLGLYGLVTVPWMLWPQPVGRTGNRYGIAFTRGAAGCP